jgi:hypothetical protein
MSVSEAEKMAVRGGGGNICDRRYYINEVVVQYMMR